MRWLAACALVAGCAAGEGESCPKGECVSSLVCHEGKCVHPERFCRNDPHAERCTRDGLCTLFEGHCMAKNQAECDAATRCKDYGHCKLDNGCCSRDGLCRTEEEDPITHVYRLRDPARRAAALDKLATLYASALARDGGDRHGKHVRALLADIGEPLSKEKSARALELLARARYPGAAPALVEALKGYKPGGDLEPIMPEVLSAIATLRPAAAREPVLHLFESGVNEKLAHALSNAVAALAHPGWEAALIKQLDRPMAPHGDAKAWQNEVHRQRTAARALGRLRSQKAIEPLMAAALSPFKEDVAPSAIEALVLIGKPAADTAAAVLRGDHPLVAATDDQHKSALEAELDIITPAEKHRNAAAAVVLARIGRKDAVPLVLEALDKKTEDIGKARIARALVHLPHDKDVIDAFKRVYERAPLDVPISREHAGIDALAEVAPSFFDSTLAPWLVERALGWKGTDTDLAPFRDAALGAAILLTDDLTQVDRLAQLVAAAKHESDQAVAKELLATCKKSTACFIEAAKKADAKQDARGKKAAVMAGILGKAADRPAIADALVQTQSRAARELLAAALCHAASEGDAALAADLQKRLEERGAFDDPSLVETVGRLRARAQP